MLFETINHYYYYYYYFQLLCLNFLDLSSLAMVCWYVSYSRPGVLFHDEQYSKDICRIMVSLCK